MEVCNCSGETWLLCIGNIIIIADVYLILGLLECIILFQISLGKLYINYKKISIKYVYIPIIYADFYPIMTFIQ